MLSKGKEALVQTFLGALQEDKIPWRRCWSTARPCNIRTGGEYRGVNNLMLSYTAAEKGYSDPRWMTFRQAQDQGWHVRKGEQAARVEFWHYYDKSTQAVLDAQDVRRIQQTEPERMKDMRLSAYTYAVFNAEQVDGVPRLERPPSAVNVRWLREGRDILLGNLGVGFREGGDRASYLPGEDCIHMPPAERFAGDYVYVCTLLHEAAHATGHYTRLNRPMEVDKCSSAYAWEELRAELASVFIAQALGLPRKETELAQDLDRHKAYIQSWIGVLEKSPGELFDAIRDADKISDYLLEHGGVLSLATLHAEEARAEAVQDEGWEP